MKKTEKFGLFILPIISAILCTIAAIGNFYTGNLGLGISMTLLVILDILIYRSNKRIHK